MEFLDLVTKTRSIRRFDSSKRVCSDDVNHILECARRTPSAANLQRIRYIVVSGNEAKDAFSKVSLGGYLPNNLKPDISVCAPLYIVLLTEDKPHDQNLYIDVGINAEAIALAASERGISSCIIRNFDKEYFASLYENKSYVPVLVMAMGYSDERSEIVDVRTTESVKYYKDDSMVNRVPKLKLEDLIL